MVFFGGELGMSVTDYDPVVIGTGPAGQKDAIAAAEARKRVAIIGRAVMIGGMSVRTGTIHRKTIREAIFQLTGFAAKSLYGEGPRSGAYHRVTRANIGSGSEIRHRLAAGRSSG